MVPNQCLKLICGIILCLMLGGPMSYAQVRFRMESQTDAHMCVAFRDSTYTIVLDSKGSGILAVPDSLDSDYAVLYGPRRIDYFYLIPDSVQLIGLSDDNRLTFDGAGKRINEYLNSSFLQSLAPSYSMSETDYTIAWGKLFGKTQTHLDSLSLPSYFKSRERKRLYYVVCSVLQVYPACHERAAHTSGFIPSDDYFRRMDSVMVEDQTAFDFWEYKQTFKSYIQSLANYKGGETPIERLRYALDYATSRIGDPRLKDYLVHTLLYEYVRLNGAEGVDAFSPLYYANVCDRRRQVEFEKLYGQYARLFSGRKAPWFEMTSIDGSRVTLEDLAGQYVYIDVWATWCIPCCRELPHLRRLEAALADKPIRFVSISIDSDVEAWRKKVESDKLGGLQLHMDEGSSFRTDYQIPFIPRFILLDSNGCIDAKMTRPSDPETESKLRALP